MGEFVYAVTAAEGIILFSLFIERNKDKMAAFSRKSSLVSALR